MIAIEHILFAFATLVILAVVASKASGILGVPTLIIFLVIGMLAGSDGPGGIYFDDPGLSQYLGVVALALILYSGGLDTNWSGIRPILLQGVSLATLGAVITAV